MAEEKTNGFERINAALGKYYKSQGDDTFYDADSTPNGKFLFYCEENGFDEAGDDGLVEELNLGALECAYCEFDANFPIDKTAKVPPNDNDAKLQYIYNVIKQCYEKGSAPVYFSTLSLNLMVSKKNLSDTMKKYKDQAPKLLPQDQKDLLQGFAIGLKNDFPFVTYLVDAYQRDRMIHPHHDLSVGKWMEKSPYFKQLKNTINQKQMEAIKSAMESYNKRLAPSFPWRSVNKVQDRIEPIVATYVAAAEFITNTLKTGAIAPFAFELMILVQKTSGTHTVAKPILEDEDSDSASDEDDEDGFAYGDDDDDKDEDVDQYFENISGRLQNHKCAMVKEEIDPTKTKEMGRGMGLIFKKLALQIKDNGGYGQYPRKRRFCALADRRSKADSNKGKDSDNAARNPYPFYMFEPGDADKMPANMVTDWYFHAAKTCAIPSMKYKPDEQETNHQATIRVDNAYKGKMITFCFQVDSEDSVRCYMFWNGCYIRIVYPEDLKIMLQTMFDMKHGKNEEYLKNGKIDLDLENMKRYKLTDTTFEAFYKEVRNSL